MMIVQKVEIFSPVFRVSFLQFTTFVSPPDSPVGALLRCYAVVIYINHFRRAKNMLSVTGTRDLRNTGIMTNPEKSGILNFCPYPL
jgi:hypothetical protein